MSTPSYCNNPATPNGQPCQFFAANCPLHDNLAAPPSAAEAASTGAEPEKRERVDIRRLARNALEAVSEDAASPAYAARFVHAIKATEAMGEEPETLQEQMAMAALLGGVMHGIPPRDREQWELLEQNFDRRTLLDLYRWYPMTWFDDIRLDKTPPPWCGKGDYFDQLMEERREWGLRHPGWDDDDVDIEPPPWRVRVRSKFDQHPPSTFITEEQRAARKDERETVPPAGRPSDP